MESSESDRNRIRSNEHEDADATGAKRMNNTPATKRQASAFVDMLHMCDLNNNSEMTKELLVLVLERYAVEKDAEIERLEQQLTEVENRINTAVRLTDDDKQYIRDYIFPGTKLTEATEPSDKEPE